MDSATQNKRTEKMQGTEKQVSWAKDIKTDVINKIENLIEIKKSSIKTSVPSRWDTEEKIARGMAKRAVKNERVKNAVALLEEKLVKLEKIQSAKFIIDNRDNLMEVDAIPQVDFYRFISPDGTTDPRF
jgi:hypothetical protein